MTPLVSLVVTSSNHGPYIAAAIDSVRRQTYANLEIVIVDDGSTDETVSYLQDSENVADLVVLRQPRTGQSAARNRGLNAASGEIVGFMDADDQLAPTHVARLVEPLASDPTVAFAYCNVQIINRAGEPASAFSVTDARQVVSGDIFTSLVIGSYFPAHAALVRRRLLTDLGGFDPDLGPHADYEIWMRLAANGHRAVYVDDRLAKYRVYGATPTWDSEHLRRTRTAALERVLRRHPGPFATAVSAVQDLAADLRTANTWLGERFKPVAQAVEASAPEPVWRLADHMASVVVRDGDASQLAVVDAAIAGFAEPALLLHPAATVEVHVPVGRAGRLSAAFGVDADAWTRTNASACVFSVDVDSCVSASALLDPARQEGDRRWITVDLDVPASLTDHHVVTLQTRTFGEPAHARALFRHVTFS